MKVEEYRKLGIPLETLTLSVLRGIDITTPEEEKIVQALVNSKLRIVPVQKPVNYAHDKTDFKTKEEELEFQKIVDDRMAEQRPQIVDEIKADREIHTEKFCNFCDAKGPISHLKTCTRPEKSLKDKINALKQEKSKLE